MFEFEREVRRWRDRVASQDVLSRDDLDELEDHLRASYEGLVGCGLAPADAWEGARDGVGTPALIAQEYGKSRSSLWRRVMQFAYAVFGVAWFLPVHLHGTRLGQGTLGPELIPGLEAFQVAITGGAGAIGVISALTNVGMVAAMWRLSERGFRGIAGLAGVAIAAAVLNGWWLFHPDTAGELMAGYYAWWGSFGIAGTGLALRARELAKRALPAAASD